MAAVDVPVTADIETGYGADPEGVAETVRGVLHAGAVGINIEDSWTHQATPLRPAEEQAERIAAARQAAATPQVPLYINARVDTYLLAVGDPEHRLADTLDRAAQYLSAGADGVFVPGVPDRATIAALAQGIAAPLNVMVGPGSPTIGELADLGVARASLGPTIALAAYALVERGAREMLTDGTYTALADHLEFGRLNALVARG